MSSNKDKQELIKERAYYLWLEDNKINNYNPDYYWHKAEEELSFEDLSTLHKWLSTLHKWYINIEKRKLEPALEWLEEQATFKICEIIGNVTIFTGLLTGLTVFILNESENYNRTMKEDWEFLTNKELQTANFAMVQSAEELNSKPLKFPWIGYTKYEQIKWVEKGKKECEKGIKILHQIGNRRERQKFVLADLKEINLVNVRLCSANFTYADLTEANLSFGKLNGSDFFKSKLNNANFSGANLTEVSLAGAELSKAELNKANLNKANLSQANLNEANLSQANLSEANLKGTNLIKTNLKTAKNLKSANLTSSVYTKETQFPDNFKP